jgi:outer membrane receptor for ferric coprogen and ferric-rhodotorulic acid
MRFRNALLSLTWLGGTLGAAPSLAADTDAATSGKTLPTIRVEATAPATSTAAKLPLSLRETPQSVTVVTRERLDDQNLHSGRIIGIPGHILISIIGLTVAMFSVTGVVIWLRKKRAQQSRLALASDAS